MKPVEIAFVVPVFNRWDLAEPMLQSLAAMAPACAGAQLLVIDDGSRPETRNAVSALKPPFRVLLNPTNLGFAVSVNRAAGETSATILALLNSDLVLRPDWLDPMLEALTERPDAFAMGNLHFAATDGRLDHAGMVFHNGGYPIHYRDEPDFIRSRPVREFTAVSFACVLVRRERFLALGGFDTRFRNGFEDVDLCLRARCMGWPSYVANASEVGHHIASSPGRHDHEADNAHRFLERWRPLTAMWERDWQERIALEKSSWRRRKDARPAQVRPLPATQTQVGPARGPDARSEGAARVLVDLARLAPDGANGGVKVHVRGLLQAIRRLAPGRFQFLVLLSEEMVKEAGDFTDGDDEAWILPDGRAVRPQHGSPQARRLTVADASLARSLQADLLFFPLGVSDFLTADVPSIALVVDVLHRELPECLSPADVAIREVWMDRTAAWSHRIVCSTHWGATQMGRHFPLSANRLTVVRPVFPPPPAAPKPTALPPRQAFLYPANAWSHKNHDTLLVAYRLYRQSAGGDAWDLVLTGNPDEHMDRISARVRTLGLEGSVLCPGYLPARDYQHLWSRTGALVFSSLYEGFGLPVLEAMHYGIPIIAGELGAIIEVADGACLLTDIRNPRSLARAMRRIQSEPALRETLVSKGRERAATFDLDREVKGLISAFDEAIADFRRAGVTWRWPCA